MKKNIRSGVMLMAMVMVSNVHASYVSRAAQAAARVQPALRQGMRTMATKAETSATEAAAAQWRANYMGKMNEFTANQVKNDAGKALQGLYAEQINTSRQAVGRTAQEAEVIKKLSDARLKALEQNSRIAVDAGYAFLKNMGALLLAGAVYGLYTDRAYEWALRNPDEKTK